MIKTLRWKIGYCISNRTFIGQFLYPCLLAKCVYPSQYWRSVLQKAAENHCRHFLIYRRTYKLEYCGRIQYQTLLFPHTNTIFTLPPWSVLTSLQGQMHHRVFSPLFIYFYFFLKKVQVLWVFHIKKCQNLLSAWTGLNFVSSSIPYFQGLFCRAVSDSYPNEMKLDLTRGKRAHSVLQVALEKKKQKEEPPTLIQWCGCS